MKKIIALLFAITILINVFNVPSHAALNTYGMTLARTPVNKLIRGAINCLTCLLELPASIWDVSRNKGVVSGCTLGLADGVFTSFVRLATGALDAATFIIPPYDKPLLKPEYALQSFKDKMGIPPED